MPDPYQNQHSFFVGEMDAPDQTVRLAMMKLMNPAGLPPMTQEEAQRLSNRIYLEGQQAKALAAHSTSEQTMQMRQMGPIDVNSYAGSMWAAPGSYAAPRLAEVPKSRFEQTADALLKQRFGTMLPGQTMRIAGVPDSAMVPGGQQPAVPAAPIAPVAPTAQLGQGSYISNLVSDLATQPQAPGPAPTTQLGTGSYLSNFVSDLGKPSGLESLLGYQFNAPKAPVAQAQQPAFQAPQQVPQQALQQPSPFPGYKTPSPAILQMMLGNAQQAAPTSVANMSATQAFGMTPTAQTLGMERAKMQADMSAKQAAAQQDARDAAVTAEAMKQFMPFGDGAAAKLTEEGRNAMITKMMASGMSTKGMERVDQMLKMLVNKPETKKETDTAYDLELAAMRQKLGREPTQQEKSDAYQKLITLRSSTTNINTGINQFEKLAYESVEKDRAGAQQALNLLPVYQEAAKIVSSKDFISGIGANQRLAFAKALAPFGINKDQVENTEVLRSRLAMPTLALVKALGSGSGISDTDREFVQEMVGKITLEPNAIARLIKIGQKVAQTAVDDYNQRLNLTFPESSKESRDILARRSLMLPTRGFNALSLEAITAEQERRRNQAAQSAATK